MEQKMNGLHKYAMAVRQKITKANSKPVIDEVKKPKPPVRYCGEIVTRAIDSTKDDELYDKVCKLLAENPDNPKILGELIDKEYYDSLDDISKFRYILNLSEKYRALKIKVMSKG